MEQKAHLPFGHQVPKSEGVIHLAGDGRGAGWPGHSKDGNPRERAPRKGQQREGGRQGRRDGMKEQRSPNGPGVVRLGLPE